MSIGSSDVSRQRTRFSAGRRHFARSARWRLQRLRATTEALAMIGLPAVVLDASGKALAANALIDALNAHIIWLPKDRIALVDPAADALLRRAVAEIADPAATSVRSFPSKGAAANPAIVHLIPATGEARDLFGGGFGLVIVTAVTAPAAPDAALIQGLFDLTPAEARVARSLGSSQNLPKILR